MIPREKIYTALFSLVEPLGNGKPFKTVSREVIEVQTVPVGKQPVLFMDEAFEENTDSGLGLIGRKFTVFFHIGCTTEKGNAASTVLNPLIDAVELAVTQTGIDETQRLGLGDLILEAKPKGMAIKNLGNNSTDPLKRQAVCYLPVEVTFSF